MECKNGENFWTTGGKSFHVKKTEQTNKQVSLNNRC